MAIGSTTGRDPSGRVRDPFNEALPTIDGGHPPAVAEAIRSLRTAMAYEDRPLIRSHLETAFAALAEAVGDSIREGIGISQQIRAHYQRAAAEVGVSPGEAFDAVGRRVADVLDEVIRSLTGTLTGGVQAFDTVAEMPGRKELEDEIREMEAFRALLIGGWPWSHLPVPTSDPAMLARARAETERGQGVPIEELIRTVEAG